MAKLNLKVKSVNGANPVVKIDGKRIRLKKNKFGNYFADIDVADGAELSMICWDTILSPLWMLWEMLFFVVSVFGIFDWGRDKFRNSAEFSAILHPCENAQATVKFIRAQGEDSPAAELECDFDAEIVKNTCNCFDTVKRRRKIALLIKIAAWVLLVGMAIVIVANTIGK